MQRCNVAAALQCDAQTLVHSMLVSCDEATKLEVLRKGSGGREGWKEGGI